jgi:hypothetical protein
MLEILSFAITSLGFLLCGFSALFMWRGQPIPGDRGAPQVIKYRGLEVRTSAIVMLLGVSVIVAVLPLVLLYYGPEPDRSAKVEARRKLFIVGRVEDESGRGLVGARVTLTKPDGTKEETPIEADGAFDFELTMGQPDARLKLRTEKQGYRPQHLILGLNWVNFPSVLVKEGR